MYSEDKAAGTDQPEHKDDDTDDYNEADYAKAGAYANEHTRIRLTVFLRRKAHQMEWTPIVSASKTLWSIQISNKQHHYTLQS